MNGQRKEVTFPTKETMNRIKEGSCQVWKRNNSKTPSAKDLLRLN